MDDLNILRQLESLDNDVERMRKKLAAEARELQTLHEKIQDIRNQLSLHMKAPKHPPEDKKALAQNHSSSNSLLSGIQNMVRTSNSKSRKKGIEFSEDIFHQLATLHQESLQRVESENRSLIVAIGLLLRDGPVLPITTLAEQSGYSASTLKQYFSTKKHFLLGSQVTLNHSWRDNENYIEISIQPHESFSFEDPTLEKEVTGIIEQLQIQEKLIAPGEPIVISPSMKKIIGTLYGAAKKNASVVPRDLHWEMSQFDNLQRWKIVNHITNLWSDNSLLTHFWKIEDGKYIPIKSKLE